MEGSLSAYVKKEEHFYATPIKENPMGNKADILTNPTTHAKDNYEIENSNSKKTIKRIWTEEED